jgi:hypothetical protein
VGYLELVLAKVRQSDIEQFKNKIEPMEKNHDDEIHAQGLEHIDDIVKRRGEQILEASTVQLVDRVEFGQDRIARLLDEDEPINSEKIATAENQSGEDIFNKFLQTIRG